MRNSPTISRTTRLRIECPHGGRRKQNRRGATLVEFAITAPIVFLFFFAAFEFCRVAMIRHTVDNAVYEAARSAIIPGATSAEARSQASLILNTIGISDSVITVSPGNIQRDTTEVTVRIRVPLDSNSFVPNSFVRGRTVERELTMRREGV